MLDISWDVSGKNLKRDRQVVMAAVRSGALSANSSARETKRDSASPSRVSAGTHHGSYLPWLEAAQSDDFLGVQNYERQVWDSNGKPAEGVVRNAGGGEVYPASLANAVRYAHSIAQVPIIVTEHGINTDDDMIRARLIPDALAELKKAMDEGIPVRGYIHWSLLDNFEWISGYKHHYGLIAVDRTTFQRTPKPSAAVLGAIARANELPRV